MTYDGISKRTSPSCRSSQTRAPNHRYYGESLPFGTTAASYSNHGLRFLTVEQALADMSAVLTRKVELFGCASESPALLNAFVWDDKSLRCL